MRQSRRHRLRQRQGHEDVLRARRDDHRHSREHVEGGGLVEHREVGEQPRPGDDGGLVRQRRSDHPQPRFLRAPAGSDRAHTAPGALRQLHDARCTRHRPVHDGRRRMTQIAPDTAVRESRCGGGDQTDTHDAVADCVGATTGVGQCDHAAHRIARQHHRSVRREGPEHCVEVVGHPGDRARGGVAGPGTTVSALVVADDSQTGQVHRPADGIPARGVLAVPVQAHEGQIRIPRSGDRGGQRHSVVGNHGHTSDRVRVRTRRRLGHVASCTAHLQELSRHRRVSLTADIES